MVINLLSRVIMYHPYLRQRGGGSSPGMNSTVLAEAFKKQYIIYTRILYIPRIYFIYGCRWTRALSSPRAFVLLYTTSPKCNQVRLVRPSLSSDGATITVSAIGQTIGARQIRQSATLRWLIYMAESAAVGLGCPQSRLLTLYVKIYLFLKKEGKKKYYWADFPAKYVYLIIVKINRIAIPYNRCCEYSVGYTSIPHIDSLFASPTHLFIFYFLNLSPQFLHNIKI